MHSLCSWNPQKCSPTLPRPDWTSSAIHTPPFSRTHLGMDMNYELSNGLLQTLLLQILPQILFKQY